MKNYIYLFLLFACFLFVNNQTLAQDYTKQIDELISHNFESDGPGIALLVAKDGKIIYSKGYGKADLELDVNLTADHVFELGSITKQFTAVAILMLEEQGKLSLEDDILEYIPDYPTQGNTITIYQLLNHTSGIKSYTDMPSFMTEARTDRTPSEIIEIFKNEPMEFPAGTAFKYNNSGYILLGHIIEVVSDMTYAEFIDSHFFDPLGMTHSYYGSKIKLIKGRASGYTRGEGIENGKYISMSLPYAAGSLMSTVDDMLKWQNALSANTFISKENYDRATNGSELSDGKRIPYGFGWVRENLLGSPMITHGGGIFGYTTNGIYLPDEDVYVIGLSNCDYGNVNNSVRRAAAIAIDKPLPNKRDAISLSEEKLKRWIGSYEFDNGAVRFVTMSNGQLFSQREGSTKLEIYPLSEDRFIFEDGEVEYNFDQTNGKRTTVFTAKGTEYVGHEIEREAPAARVEVSIDPAILKSYEGKYELAPSFHIVVTSKENQLFLQATGQPQFEVFAESETDFFLKVVEANVIFSKDDEGEIMLTLHQGGQVLPGKKVD